MLRSPADFPRRVLLVVTGLAPQVVTETVWALAGQSPTVLPTEITVVTTGEGARRARLLLLGTRDRPGALATLAAQLGIVALPLTIVAIRGADGHVRDDLTSEADNTAAADAIVNAVREATADPDSAVHMSIAGGRKTMGFLAGMALSLFGREQDRLSHVLVAPPFQGHPEFFFPPASPRVLIAAGGQPFSTDEAGIVLTDIPFLRLRHGFSAAELDRPGGYAAAIAAVQQHLGPPSLLLDLPAGRLVLGGTPLVLPPTLLGAMLWFARQRLKGKGSVSWREADAGEWVQAATDAAGATTAQSAGRAVRQGMTADLLAEKKTRLNQRVRMALGASAGSYLIETVGRCPVSRYRLATPPEAISIIAENGRREMSP